MTIDDILERVESSATRLVRFLYCDLSGIIRGKTTHTSRLRDRIESGIGLVKGQLSMNLLDQIQLGTGYGAIGEVRLVPDLNTFVCLPYLAQTALVLCDLFELDRMPWALCSRSLLKKQIARAESLGISFKAAFEPEFMIGYENDGDYKPIDRGLCFSTESMNRAAAFVSSFIYALERQAVEVEQYYAELGHGQHEVSIRHAEPLGAADRHIVYRETLRGVALEKGMMASLAPKPFKEQPGNGCHLHFSAWDKSSGTNLLWSPSGLSDFGGHFVAGILAHLPALVALTCPSVNSYRRLQPHAWSSAYVCWGFENREAAVRVPSLYWGREQESANIEIKCVDSSINPYLALSAVIAAGLDGVERKLDPPEPVDCDPGSLSEEELASRGIRRLPVSLKDALLELEKDSYLVSILGEELARAFLVVKHSEHMAFAVESVEFELEHHRVKF